jgi:hypothetical protein
VDIAANPLNIALLRSLIDLFVLCTLSIPLVSSLLAPLGFPFVVL